MAHELAQPLNATSIICQSLVRYASGPDAENLKTELREVLSQVQSMRKIIDQLRLFVRGSTAVTIRDVTGIIDIGTSYST